MPRKSLFEKRRVVTVSIAIAEGDYAVLKAIAWSSHRTISTILYTWLQPFVQESLKHPEIQSVMKRLKEQEAPPRPISATEQELDEFAQWLQEDRIRRQGEDIVGSKPKLEL